MIFYAEKKIPPCPLGNDYTLDAENSDEFNGSGLDENKWWDYAPLWRGRKEFIFSHNNVSVKNGFLELVAKTIPEEEMTYEDRGNGIMPYTMPTVKSRKKVTYGYFECRSRGTAAEIRNSFWLYDPLSDKLNKKYGPGSHSEEIDIYEFIGKYQEPQPIANAICSHVHRFETPYVEGVVNGEKTFLPDEGGWLEVDWAPCEDYHIYGLLWNEDEIIWYLDNKEYYKRKNDYFHTPLHIMFNCELACWREARVDTLDKSTLPATHSVEYFRRWVKK